MSCCFATGLSDEPWSCHSHRRWCNPLAAVRTMHAFGDALTVQMFSSGVQKAKSFQMFFSYLFFFCCCCWFSITVWREAVYSSRTESTKKKKKSSFAVQMPCLGLTAALVMFTELEPVRGWGRKQFLFTMKWQQTNIFTIGWPAEWLFNIPSFRL